MAFRIVTNNPQVKEHYGEKQQIHWIEGNYLAVLEFVRDEVHKGYPLLTHPLSGSIKPNETPYKSILLDTEKCHDLSQSVIMIEDSIMTAKKFLNIRDRTAGLSLDLHQDFQEIDFQLIKSGIESAL